MQKFIVVHTPIIFHFIIKSELQKSYIFIKRSDGFAKQHETLLSIINNYHNYSQFMFLINFSVCNLFS